MFHRVLYLPRDALANCSANTQTTHHSADGADVQGTPLSTVLHSC